MRKLWDHLESCWDVDPRKRPSAADAVKFLEETGRNIAQSLASEPDIPELSHLREEPVLDLTGRVKGLSVRPFAEGRNSNIWKGALDNDQLVRSHRLITSLLIMSAGRD
jgi:hypothetical protein